MKKYFTFISLIIFSLLLIGCNTHEHYYEKQYIDPTCTESGTIVYTCECGDSYTETVSEPLGHEYGDWEVIQNPTMYSEGTKEQKCIRCNNTNTEQIEKREYPDLGGYTIHIAVNKHNLSSYDPFNDRYYYYDREAKQRAWKEVEKNFNCKIKYVGYPEGINYGPERWNFIIDNINNKTLYYDFCEVANQEIANFINYSKIVNLEDYYYKYSPHLMDEVQKASSSYKNDIYAISDSKNYYMMVMVYNILLLERLQEVDPTLKEPAQIYLEGNWTQDEFLRYCEQVQSAMEKLYGEQGKKGSKKQEYYAFGGWPTNLWAGLSTSKQEPILDINKMSVNLTTESKIKNLEFVKALYDNNLADPKIALTGGSISFNQDQSLFECGEVFDYLIKYDSFTGFGKGIDIGFVLFPRENDSSFEDISIPAYGSRYYIMAEQQVYSKYGSECNVENVYWAFSEYIKKSREYCDNKNWDSIALDDDFKENICESDASKKLSEYLHNKFCNDEIYYEPTYDYQFMNTLFSNKIDCSISQTLNAYIFDELDTTWEDAIQVVITDLKNRLNQRYS